MTRQLPNKQMQQKYLRKENTVGLGVYNNKTSKSTGFTIIIKMILKKFEKSNSNLRRWKIIFRTRAKDERHFKIDPVLKLSSMLFLRKWWVTNKGLISETTGKNLFCLFNHNWDSPNWKHFSLPSPYTCHY